MPTEQELLDLFNSRNESADKAARKPEKTAENAEAKELYNECQTAIEKIVLPYLAGLHRKFGPGKFWYGIHRDPGDGRPSGISFRIGTGRPTHISTADGNISVMRGDILDRATNPADQAPEISSPADLTADNIGKLVEVAIRNP